MKGSSEGKCQSIDENEKQFLTKSSNPDIDQGCRRFPGFPQGAVILFLSAGEGLLMGGHLDIIDDVVG